MSNLGLYQQLTTWSKKVGGPEKLIALFMGSGYIIGKSSELVLKKVVKTVKKSNKKEKQLTKIYTVIANGKSNDELTFNIGDKYKVLESDGKSVLIEKIGDTNNPYFVSADFLSSISNFVL